MLLSIILLIVLIALNAVFASAEIAVISMNEVKLHKMAEGGDRRAKKLEILTKQPARFLATIQVAITLAGFLQSAFAADKFADPLVELLVGIGITINQNVLRTISIVVITIILSYFSLVFGELVPKRVAMKKAEELSLKLAGLLYGVAKIFAPIVSLLTVSTNGLLRLMGIDPEEEGEKVTEEEIRMMLDEGNKQGTIREEETEMIRNIFEFNDKSAEEICTHRKDVVMLRMGDNAEEWEKTILGNRHSYYPVCGETWDDIIGVLDAKDYFRLEDRSKENLLAKACDEPLFIWESMKANKIFRKMKDSRTYFAVVLDEYGGFSGILTLHDLTETIVGDIDDPDDPIRPKDVVKLQDGAWKIQGSALLEDVTDITGVEFPVDTYETFSGFVFGLIKRVPDDGEHFECEDEKLHITVLGVKDHTVTEAMVKLKDS